MIVLMNENERTVRRWFVKFRFGDFSLKDESRSGRPTVIEDEDLRTLVETDPSQTVCGMAEELGVSSCAGFGGLKRNGKVKKLEKWSEIVTFRGLFFFAFAQLKRHFLDWIVTCNEKWIL